jgi:hypothetical protein
MFINGCNRDLSVFDESLITKVELIYPKGGMVVTNSLLIADLTQAMRSAQVDNTIYDTPLSLRLDF